MTNHFTRLHPAFEHGHDANLMVCFQVHENVIYWVINDMAPPRQLEDFAHQGIYTEIKNMLFTTAVRSICSTEQLDDPSQDGFPYIGTMQPAELL